MDRLKHIVQVNVILGAWLIAAPFLLHYQWMSRAFVNDLGVGILSVLVSATGTWMFVSRARRTA
jgi:hypothetical protein